LPISRFPIADLPVIGQSNRQSEIENRESTMATLVWLMIFVPAIGGLACLFVPTRDMARKWALGTAIVVFVMSMLVARGYYGSAAYQEQGGAAVQFVTHIDWIKSINVEFRTGVDGLSLPLVILTTALSILVILAAWKTQKAANAYLALYLFLLTGMLGVFLALDLFLFYVFFEISLLPMYFLIGIWGGPRKEYAAIKFFLYTLAGSICLLVVMLGLYYYTGDAAGANGQNTWIMVDSADVGESGKLSLQSEPVRELFGAPSAADEQLDAEAQARAADQGQAALPALRGSHWIFGQWAFWLTLIAFMIKLPAVPFHTWLPDAHVEAPTPISMILAGVLLKMGGYAMMRITWPIFPDAGRAFWFAVSILGVIAIIYGAFCAMAQSDWKKLVAYSSVSHMGYVLLGLAVMTTTAFNGAYFQMIAHGITSAAMFFLVGVVYDRAHHRDIDRFGGLWLKWPGYGGWALVLFFAGMGLPGLCGFIGEIMVLLGTFEAAGQFPPAQVYTIGILAASGVVLTAGYILWMFQRVFMGKPRPEYDGYEPVNKREYSVMIVLGIAAFLFGIIPWLVFSMTDPTVEGLKSIIGLSG
jgi:NADH-quinone oxidoreductase subunit M